MGCLRTRSPHTGKRLSCAQTSGGAPRIAGILMQQGKMQEANAQVDAMKKIAPKHPQTLYAAPAFSEKNYVAAREAIQLYLRACWTTPTRADATIAFQLGAYAGRDQPDEGAAAGAEGTSRQTILVNTYLAVAADEALEAMKPVCRAKARTMPTSSRWPAKLICRTATSKRRSGSSPRLRRSIRRTRTSGPRWP